MSKLSPVFCGRGEAFRSRRRVTRRALTWLSYPRFKSGETAVGSCAGRPKYLGGCKRGVSNGNFCPLSSAHCHHLSIKLR
jgi:hypothetical protein